MYSLGSIIWNFCKKDIFPLKNPNSNQVQLWWPSWFYDRHGKQTTYNIKVYLIYKINQFNKSELFLTYSYVPEYGKLQFGSVPLLCSKKSRDNEPSLWPGCSVDNGVRKNIFKRNRIKINAIQDLNKMKPSKKLRNPPKRQNTTLRRNGQMTAWWKCTDCIRYGGIQQWNSSNWSSLVWCIQPINAFNIWSVNVNCSTRTTTAGKLSSNSGPGDAGCSTRTTTSRQTLFQYRARRHTVLKITT